MSASAFIAIQNEQRMAALFAEQNRRCCMVPHPLSSTEWILLIACSVFVSAIFIALGVELFRETSWACARRKRARGQTSAPNALKAGAALAVVGIAIALSTKQITPPPHSLTHVGVPFSGAAPAGTDCLWATALATPGALGVFGLQADAGQQYARVRVCAPPDPDAGDGPALPAGMFPLTTTETEEQFDGGQPALEAWLASDPGANFACACSPGLDAGCLVPSDDGGTQPAPVGVTLQPGWSGSCARKPCTEFAGITSWPDSCPRSP